MSVDFVNSPVASGVTRVNGVRGKSKFCAPRYFGYLNNVKLNDIVRRRRENF